jgi:hypothetical protein
MLAICISPGVNLAHCDAKKYAKVGVNANTTGNKKGPEGPVLLELREIEIF